MQRLIRWFEARRKRREQARARREQEEQYRWDLYLKTKEKFRVRVVGPIWDRHWARRPTNLEVYNSVRRAPIGRPLMIGSIPHCWYQF